MGADNFRVRAFGKTAEAAFSAVVDEAKWEHGHGGYTGTIAEKNSFIVCPPPKGVDPTTWADWIEHDGTFVWEEVPQGSSFHRSRTAEDGRTVYELRKLEEVPAKYRGNSSALRKAQGIWNDKWGPAVCVPLDEAQGKFLFLGLASS